jgi:hypothetical protein
MMADILPYLLLVAAVVTAGVVVVSSTVSTIRKRLRRPRRGKSGPAENAPGRSSANPHAPQDQPDPRGWTWLLGPP